MIDLKRSRGIRQGKKKSSRIEKRRRANLGRRWSGVHGRKDLCTQQQKDQGRNSKRKSRSRGYRTPRVTSNAGSHQKNLLVARVEEICARLFQMSTEQDSTPKESRKTTPIGYSRRTIARNQY